MIVKAFAAFGVAIIYLLLLFTAAYAIAFLNDDMRNDDFDICLIANIIQAVIVILFLWERILK